MRTVLLLVIAGTAFAQLPKPGGGGGGGGGSGFTTAGQVVGSFAGGSCVGFLKSDTTCSTVTGTGDVNGPASSTNLHVAVFSGTGGKTIIDGGNILADFILGTTRGAANGVATLDSGSKIPVGQIPLPVSNNVVLYKDNSGNIGAGVAGLNYAAQPGALNTSGATPNCDQGTDFHIRNCYQTLVANVTGATFSNLYAGAQFTWAWKQGASAYTVAYSGAVTNTCQINPTNGVTTTQSFVSDDGVNVRGTGCTDDAGFLYYYGAEGSIPTTSAAGFGGFGLDNVRHTVVAFSNNSANPHIMPRTSRTDDRLGFGDLADTAADNQLSANVPLKNGNNIFTGVIDNSGISSIKPFPQGTSLPATCAVGNTFYKTDATAGQNIYLCTTTNTWTQVVGTGGGGGSGVGRTTVSPTFTLIRDGACQTQTATWTGITTSDVVIMAMPAIYPGSYKVSAANTLSITLCNLTGDDATPGTVSMNAVLAIYNLTSTSSLNFSNLPDQSCATQTFTLTGAQLGDPVAPQWPNDYPWIGNMRVSSANTVTVRACNYTGDTASYIGTFGAVIAR